MIGLGQQAVELGKEKAGIAVVHADCAPGLRSKGAGPFGVARGDQCPDQQDRASCGFRLPAGKDREHLLSRRILVEKSVFEQARQSAETRPAFQFERSFRDLAGRNILQPGQGDRPGQDVPVERAARKHVADPACKACVSVTESFEADVQRVHGRGNRSGRGLNAGNLGLGARGGQGNGSGGQGRSPARGCQDTGQYSQGSESGF
jgi:hypothetical protein